MKEVHLNDEPGLVSSLLPSVVRVGDDLGVESFDSQGLLLRLDQPSPFRRSLVSHPQYLHAEAAAHIKNRHEV